MSLRFQNRLEAGTILAKTLARFAGRSDVVVLALPRGGVPVAFPVAVELGAPLDVAVVRKLGVPGFEELAMGAIACGGVRVLHHEVLKKMEIPDATVAEVAAREGLELERRERAYRGGRAAPDLWGKTVILVDDGLATGSTMRAAIDALGAKGVARTVVAVPAGSADTCTELEAEADEVICLSKSEEFTSVGQYYDDFSPTTDEEVGELLDRAAMEEAKP